MSFLALLDDICYLQRFALATFIASALVEVLNAPTTHVLGFVGNYTVNHSALHIFSSLGHYQCLVLLFFLPDLLVEFVVCLMEAFPNAFNHVLMLLAVFHIGGVSCFQFFDLAALVVSLGFLVQVG
jgi:hypothetical protein